MQVDLWFTPGRTKFAVVYLAYKWKQNYISNYCSSGLPPDLFEMNGLNETLHRGSLFERTSSY